MSGEPKGTFSEGDSKIDERPRDASTVILIRESDALEVLLVRRHSKSAFMGGAYVFPGGKLDEADRSERVLAHVSAKERARFRTAVDETPGVALSEADAVGLAVAAARELFEEAGVLLARRDGEIVAVDDSDRTVWIDWQRRVHEGGASFIDMIDEEGLELALDALTYWAHWVTPSAERRRFDARFFLARMPEGQTPLLDQKEAVELRWLTPTAALSAHREGEIFLPPPTLRNLEDFGAHTSVSALLEMAENRAVAAILPKLTLDGERIAILLPWDPEYEACDGASLPIDFSEHPFAAGASRIYVDGGQFQAAKGGS